MKIFKYFSAAGVIFFLNFYFFLSIDKRLYICYYITIKEKEVQNDVCYSVSDK